MADLLLRMKAWFWTARLDRFGDRGTAAVEYALILALVVVVCILAVDVLGQNSNSFYRTTGSSIGAN